MATNQKMRNPSWKGRQARRGGHATLKDDGDRKGRREGYRRYVRETKEYNPNKAGGRRQPPRAPSKQSQGKELASGEAPPSGFNPWGVNTNSRRITKMGIPKTLASYKAWRRVKGGLHFSLKADKNTTET